jgi:hypothetical protein
VALAAGAALALASWLWERTPSGGSAPAAAGTAASDVASPASGIATTHTTLRPAPRADDAPSAPATPEPMPPLEQRLARFAEAWLPRLSADQRARLAEAGGAVASLEAFEAARPASATLDSSLRAARAEVTTRLDAALRALSPQVRAAMRRHRITIHQLSRYMRESGGTPG